MPEKYGYLYRSNMSLPRHGIRDYISNGLICHLDGIDNTGNGHDPNAAVWRDLSGNNSFTLHGCSWRSNCLHFDDNTYALGTQMNPSAITVEVMMRIDEWLPRVDIFNNIQSGGGGIAILEDSLNVRYHDGQSYISININEKPSEIFTISMVLDGLRFAAYINAVKYSSTSGGFFTPATMSTVWGIGTNPVGKHKDNPDYENLIGNVYCARIYDRGLSAEEIAHNHRIDTLRFR